MITTHRHAMPTAKMECWVHVSSGALFFFFIMKLQFMKGVAEHTCYPTNALLSLKGRGRTPENPLCHKTTKNTRNVL